jgi:hypothetical protein
MGRRWRRQVASEARSAPDQREKCPEGLQERDYRMCNITTFT